MVIDDYKFGRLVRIQHQQTSITAGSNLSIPANKDRVAILICPGDAADNQTVKIESSTGTIIHNFGDTPNRCEFNLADQGELVQRQLVIVNGSLVAVSYGVVEMILPESWLHLIRR